MNDLNETQKLKENAEKKLREYNEIIENSKKGAKKIIEDSKKKLDQDIENEIRDLKTTSILSISKIATETSAEIIKHIIGTEVNKSNVSAIVNDIAKRRVEKLI